MDRQSLCSCPFLVKTLGNSEAALDRVNMTALRLRRLSWEIETQMRTFTALFGLPDSGHSFSFRCWRGLAVSGLSASGGRRRSAVLPPNLGGVGQTHDQDIRASACPGERESSFTA